MTSPALDAPLRSLREAPEETQANIKREFEAARRLYGLIDHPRTTAAGRNAEGGNPSAPE
jgi:hypothetical protein